MKMTPERLAELDAAVAHDTRGVMTLLYKNWPDASAHIDAQAATIAGLTASMRHIANYFPKGHRITELANEALDATGAA